MANGGSVDGVTILSNKGWQVSTVNMNIIIYDYNHNHYRVQPQPHDDHLADDHQEQQEVAGQHCQHYQQDHHHCHSINHHCSYQQPHKHHVADNHHLVPDRLCTRIRPPGDSALQGPRPYISLRLKVVGIIISSSSVIFLIIVMIIMISSGRFG